jgi:hypothetical protein
MAVCSVQASLLALVPSAHSLFEQALWVQDLPDAIDRAGARLPRRTGLVCPERFETLELRGVEYTYPRGREADEDEEEMRPSGPALAGSRSAQRHHRSALGAHSFTVRTVTSTHTHHPPERHGSAAPRLPTASVRASAVLRNARGRDGRLSILGAVGSRCYVPTCGCVKACATLRRDCRWRSLRWSRDCAGAVAGRLTRAVPGTSTSNERYHIDALHSSRGRGDP